ncbi:hypothetical protein ACI2OX_06450 [Bacillus sp. N9]
MLRDKGGIDNVLLSRPKSKSRTFFPFLFGAPLIGGFFGGLLGGDLLLRFYVLAHIRIHTRIHIHRFRQYIMEDHPSHMVMVLLMYTKQAKFSVKRGTLLVVKEIITF